MLDVPARQETSKRRIRLVVADRQPIILQGLRWLFTAQHDFEIVASCSNGTSCLGAIRNLAPDVALLADTLPYLTVSEILATAKAENLSTRLVFFTESENDDDLAAAVAAGACSAISKYANPDTLLRSLRLITEHSASPKQSQYISPNGKEVDDAKIERMLELLTHRERQIVQLVSDGMSNKEIARQLNVSHGTVKVHIHNIFQKLEISNRTVLATIALLRRPAGFTLSLTALAFAILEDVKAAEKNDIFLDDDSTAYNGLEHPGFELWKKAILRHVIVVNPGETVVPAQRDSSTKVSQATNSAASMEVLHAAKQTDLSSLGRGHGPIGSSTPDLFISPLLQAINNSQIGSPTAQNPMKSHGGYGTFTMAAGAWIYALDQSHAAVPSLGAGETLIDTSTAVTMDGATKMATITIHGAHNAGPNDVATHSNSTQPDSIIDFRSGTDKINLAAFGALAFLQMTSASTSVPPLTVAWIYNPASNETIVYVNPTDRSLDIGDPALLEIHLQGVVSVAESDLVYQREAAAVAGIDAALLVATASDGTALTTDSVHASIEAGASESTPGTAGVWIMPADDGFRFHFGPDRIGSDVSARLISFGDDPAYSEESDGAAGVSASIELAPSNAMVPAEENLIFMPEPIRANTIALSIEHGTAHATAGPELFELGMQSAAMSAPAAVAVIEPGVAPGNSAGHGNSEHASESAFATAAATEPAEPGILPGDGAGHGNGTEPQASNSAAAKAPTASETAAPGVESGYSYPEHPSHSASAIAMGSAEPIEADLAPGYSAGHSNSQQALQSASAKAAATEPQASNSAAAKTPTASEMAAPDVESGHSNSEHPSHSASASAKGTAEPIEAGLAPGNSAGHGNSQQALQSASATAAATEPAEPGIIPGNGVGHGTEPQASNSAAAKAPTASEMAAPGVEPGHGNPEHPSHSASAIAMGPAEPIEADLAPGNSAGHSNSQQASQSAALNASKAASKIGGAGQEPAFHFNHQANPSAPTAAVELEVFNDSPDLLGHDVELAAIPEVGTAAMYAHAASNGQHHVKALLPHDLLI